MCQSQERKSMKGLGERHPKLTMKVSPRCAQKRWRARSWYVRHALVAASPVSPLPPAHTTLTLTVPHNQELTCELL